MMTNKPLCDLALIVGKQDKQLLSLDIYTHHYLLPFTPRLRTIDFILSSLIHGNISPILVLTPEDADLIHNYILSGWPDLSIYVFDKHKTEQEFLPFLQELKVDHSLQTIGIFYGHFPSWFSPLQCTLHHNYTLFTYETPFGTFPVGIVLPFRAFEEGLKATSQENLYTFLENIIDSVSKEKHIHTTKLLGYFQPCFSLQDYYRIHIDLLDDYHYLDHLCSLVPLRPTTKLNLVSRTTKTSHVINSIMGENVRIEGHVENSVIFSNVIIDKKAFIKNSIILPGNHIGSEARIVNTIIDEFSLENVEPNIGHKAQIGSESASSPNKRFPQLSSGFTLIGKDSFIHPRTIIGGNCYVDSFLPPTFTHKIHQLKDGEYLCEGE